MAQVRWGLIGATTIGREWMIDAIRAAGGVIVGVMSTNAERGRTYADTFGIGAAPTSIEALLNLGIDAVYIATTNELHRDQCLAAAAAGKHVLCEKPLATNLADARAMVAACAAAGVVMGTNHHLRNAATHHAVRDAIRAGRIGRPLAIKVVHAGFLPEHLHGWRLKDPTAGAGAVLDLTVHDADLMRFVTDDEPVAVTAMVQNGGLAAAGIEDAAMGVIRFRSGLIGHFHDGFTTRHIRTSLEVHGSEGSLVATNCMSQSPVGEVALRTAAGEEALHLAHEDLYARGVRAFHGAIDGEGRPAATGEDGVRSLAVAIATLESARAGREVEVG